MIRPLDLIRVPDEDEALREPVRAFLSDYLKDMPVEKRAGAWMGVDREFSRAFAAQGFVGLTLPKEWGGGGRSQFARFVVLEELLAAGAPAGGHWAAERQSAPLMLRFGTDAQKALVPAICRGELFFCIGMSEAGSGSDLASVRTKAELTPDGWRINGTKIWTTYGHMADYMIGLVRTSGAPEDRGKGLSQLLIDLKTPGISRRPIRDLSGQDHFSEVHFDDVLVPRDALIGEEGRGWAQVTAELAFERSGPERVYSSVILVDEWLRHVRAKGEPTVADKVLAGRLFGQLAVLRNMSLAVTSMLGDTESPVIEATVVKDLGTTYEQSVPDLILDHLAGDPGEEIPRSLAATLEFEGAMCPSFSLRGGTREILRGMIARGLGLR